MDLINLTASAAVALMRSGELSAERYAQTLLDRAEQLRRLNAFRTLPRDSVLEAARAADKARLSGAAPGLLHGLPLPVKDSINTRASPTSNGARALESFRPRTDAAVLQPLFAQGAILMGKTNLHELSRGWTSNNFAFGAVLNPYDRQVHSGRQQRRIGRGGRRTHRAARARGRYARIHTHSGQPVRSCGSATDIRPLSRRWNHAAHPRQVRPGRAARAVRGGSRAVRRRRHWRRPAR